MGGKKTFASRLDTLFTMHLPDSFFAETEDITREGIIGGYVHGNEPHIMLLIFIIGQTTLENASTSTQNFKYAIQTHSRWFRR